LVKGAVMTSATKESRIDPGIQEPQGDDMSIIEKIVATEAEHIVGMVPIKVLPNAIDPTGAIAHATHRKVRFWSCQYCHDEMAVKMPPRQHCPCPTCNGAEAQG
jgi:hypothetical protein